MNSSDKYTYITEVLQRYDESEISHDDFPVLRGLVHENFDDIEFDDITKFKDEVKTQVDSILLIGLESYMESI